MNLRAFVVALAMLFKSVLSYGQEDVHVKDITLDNYKEFEGQLRRELPKGTPAVDVEKYLTDRGIDYSLAKHDKAIYVLIPKIDRYLLFFSTDLWIKFRMDGEGDKQSLREIDVELVNTGP